MEKGKVGSEEKEKTLVQQGLGARPLTFSDRPFEGVRLTVEEDEFFFLFREVSRCFSDPTQIRGNSSLVPRPPSLLKCVPGHSYSTVTSDHPKRRPTNPLPLTPIVLLYGVIMRKLLPSDDRWQTTEEGERDDITDRANVDEG